MSIRSPLGFLFLTALLALSGCGSSSSSGGKSPSPGQPPGPGDTNGEQTQVIGEAVKGILKNAQVTAYELSAQGRRVGGLVGEARTDANGEYELALGDDYSGGMIEIEVTALEDTTMVCDASQCGAGSRGDDIAVPQEFVLRTIAEKPADGNKVSAAVTAWTTMAANRAKALLENGDRTELRDAQRQANSEVAQVVGFDFTRVRARGVSQLDGADDDQAQYAVMNAAVAEIVFRDNGSSLSDQLTQFTTALNDGRFGNDGDGFSTAEVAQAISRSVSGNAAQVSSTVSDRLASQSARLESGGSDGFEPTYDDDLDVDDDASDAEKIEAYQAFMGQVRTWLSAAGEMTPEQLTNAVNIDEETLRATVDAQTQARFQYLGEVLGQMATFAADNVETLADKLENGGTQEIIIRNNQGDEAGRAELSFADNNGLAITAKGWALDDSSAEFAPFEVALATGVPVGDIIIDRVDNALVSARITRILADTTMKASAHIGDLNGSHYVSLDNVELNISLSKALQSNDSGEFDVSVAEAAFKGASFSGNAAINSDGYRFDGAVDIELVKLNEKARLFVGEESQGSILAPKTARLSGEFVSADEATRFTAVASVNLHNAAAFDTFSWLDNRGSAVYVQGAVNHDEDLANTALDFEVSDENTVLAQRHFEVGYGSTYFYEARFVEAPHDKAWHSFPNAWSEEHRLQIQQEALDTVFSADTVYVTYWPAGASESRTIEYPVSDLLADATFEHGWVQEDSYWSSENVTIRLPSGLVSEVEGYAEVTVGDYSGYLDFSWDGQALMGVGRDWSHSSPEDSLMAKFLPLIDHPLADQVEIHALDLASYGFEAQFPRTQEFYNLCMNHPEQWFSPYEVASHWFVHDLDCARSTLGYGEYESPRALNASEEKAVNDLIASKVESYFHKAVSYDFHYAGVQVTVGGAGTWSADVDIVGMESADYYLQGSITASLGIQLPELPNAQLTATFNRTAFDTASLRTHIDWNGGNYTVDIAANDLQNPEAIDLRFFNAQGYELAVTVTLAHGEVQDVSGRALINGEAVGEVQWRDGRPMLVFADGDENVFESLY